jgi:UrcA family protein
MIKLISVAAAAATSILIASVPASAAQPSTRGHSYSVPVSIKGLSLSTSEGQRTFLRRAHAASLRACGQSLGRGAADEAANRECREAFSAAAVAEANRSAPRLEVASNARP